MSYTDKYGVKFSNDGKTLEYCPKDFKGKYEIPFGVTTIGVPFFLRLDLDNLDKWSDDAFANCPGLTEIVIPNSVKEIEEEAFSNCTALKEIRIPDNTIVDEKVFEGCVNIKKIYCSNLFQAFFDLPAEIIYSTAYFTIQITKKRNWYLRELHLPDNYRSARYTRVRLHDDEHWGSELDAFLYDVGLEHITKGKRHSLNIISVSSNNPQVDSREDCNAAIDTETNTLLIGCNSTIIPNSVTSIADYAFQNCRKIKTIRIPDSVTSIGDFAFKGCNGLCEIHLPESISAIGECAFPHVKSLKRIIIPKGKRNHFLKIGLKDYSNLIIEE